MKSHFFSKTFISLGCSKDFVTAFFFPIICNFLKLQEPEATDSLGLHTPLPFGFSSLKKCFSIRLSREYLIVVQIFPKTINVI